MTATPLQTTTEQVTGIATELLGLAVLAGTLAAIVALGYRWLSREQVPAVLALLVGLGAVAVYINTTTAVDRTIAGEATITTEIEVALFSIGSFLVGAGGGIAGQRTGDRFARDVLLDTGESNVDEDVNRLVRTVGRVVTVTLPEEIDDVMGYDPVPEATRETLAGQQFVFPQNLTVEELHRRLVSRLKTDYGVGTVDVELADDGSVEYFAVGSRAAGIGPTLPPATNAVAVRADPAFSASAGDVVQVWETDPMQRVLTAELRGVAGDVVTIAIDAADTPKLDPRERYRLVTLPVEDRPEREFASLLRAADVTFSTVTVEAGSPLHGMPVGALDLTVVAIKPGDGAGTTAALPGPSRVLAPGDVVFAIARPERLRRLDAAADPLDPSLVRDVGRPSLSEDPGSGDPTPEITSPEPAGPESTDGEPETATGDQPSQDPVTTDDSAQTGPVADSGPDADGSEDAGETSAASSFDDLKAEFEAGNAEWASDDGTDFPDGSPGTDPDPASDTERNDGGSGQEDDSSSDDLVDFAEADISFEDDPGSLEPDEGDDDDLLGPRNSEDDDLGSIGFDESEDDDLLGPDDGDTLFSSDGSEDDDFDAVDGPVSESEDGDNGEADEDGEDDGEGGDDGGGSKSFADLKEEFESGEADWEDDISDSPGGDMRLDE